MNSDMGWKLSDLLGPRIVASNMTSSWRPGTNSIHEGFLLCPDVLNIFVSDLSDGTLNCTQQVCSWYKTQKSGWYTRGLCCCSETCYLAGEKRRRKPCEIQWRHNAKFYTWVGIISCTSYMLTGKQLCRERSEVPGRWHQCALMAEKIQQLPWLRREVTFSFYALLMKPWLDNYAWFCCVS